TGSAPEGVQGTSKWRQEVTSAYVNPLGWNLIKRAGIASQPSLPLAAADMTLASLLLIRIGRERLGDRGYHLIWVGSSGRGLRAIYVRDERSMRQGSSSCNR